MTLCSWQNFTVELVIFWRVLLILIKFVSVFEQVLFFSDLARADVALTWLAYVGVDVYISTQVTILHIP